MEVTIDHQLTLEKQWHQAGHQRFLRNFGKQWVTDSAIGSHLMSKAYADMLQATKDLRDNVGNLRDNLLKTLFFVLTPEDVAAVTLRTMLNVAYRSLQGDNTKCCMSSTVMTVAEKLLDQFNYRLLCDKEPAAVKWMEDFLKGKTSKYRYRTLRFYKENLLGGNLWSLDGKARANLGWTFVSRCIETTGLFEVHTVFSGVRSLNVLTPTPEVLAQCFSHLETIAWMHPLCMPMVVSPKPWTSPRDGGYYMLSKNIITHGGRTSAELFAAGHLESRMTVLNWIQSVPWEIDHELADLMNEAYRYEHRTVPKSDINLEETPKPWDGTAEGYRRLKATNPDLLAEWKLKRALQYQEFYNSRAIGQRLAFLRVLSIAKSYRGYDTVWFPWRLDYRGRFYPIPEGLSPHGDDFGKALLRFKQRTPLTPQSNPRAWEIYQIEGANLMGVDKVPFSERISFIRDNHYNILASAEDYLGCSWWEDADKPWRMLAWCREYSRITRGQQDYTQLPIGLDGSCNGLQHLALATRDEQTGALVNLIPSDRPADIYSNVVAAVEAALPEDSYWKGRVTRKLVKRNTMTTPYNVTQRGMGDQIKEELKAETETGRLDKTDFKRANELRDYNYSAIQQLLGKAAELMAWYSEVARAYMQKNLRIEWSLPDGYRVIQDLRRRRSRRVRLETQRVNIYIQESTPVLDNRRNASALAPNVTHSMDATHMTLFIQWLISQDADCPFVGVHDSFGLPAPKVASLGEGIVKTLVELYKSFDITEALRSDYRTKTGQELSPPPDPGCLCLDGVLESKYAFS